MCTKETLKQFSLTNDKHAVNKTFSFSSKFAANSKLVLIGQMCFKTKLIARLVLWQKGKIYWPIFQLA